MIGLATLLTPHRSLSQMPPGDITYTEPSKLLSQQHGTDKKQLGGNPLSVIVAAGPYTVDSDLEYEPLGALLEMVEGERPDVLVLVSVSRLNASPASLMLICPLFRSWAPSSTLTTL